MHSLAQVTEIDFDWPKRFWTGLSKQDQDNLIRLEFKDRHSLRSSNVPYSNVVGHLGTVTSVKVRQRQVALFALVDPSRARSVLSTQFVLDTALPPPATCPHDNGHTGGDPSRESAPGHAPHPCSRSSVPSV